LAGLPGGYITSIRRAGDWFTGLLAWTDPARYGLVNHHGENQVSIPARLTALTEAKLRSAGIADPHQRRAGLGEGAGPAAQGLAWVDFYNHQGGYSALRGRPAISRCQQVAV
jgi:hypothetical protein